jgi:hypothetical protein
VISVWFEKKKGMDSKVLISSPVFGPKAQILVASLALIDIPAHVLTSQDELLFELVLKNLYILTTNIAGLLIEKEATVEDLHNQHPNLMHKISNDILSLQAQLTGQTFDTQKLEQSIIQATKICALGPNTGEEINTLESMPFFFSNHTEITVGLIKLCVAQSRGNNSFCIIATRSFHALGIDFRADCNSPSPVQTKINSGSINERNSSISVALVMG